MTFAEKRYDLAVEVLRMTSRVLLSFAFAVPLTVIGGACGGTVESGGSGGNDASTQDGTSHGPDATTGLDGTGGRDTNAVDGVNTGEASTGLPCGMTTCSSTTQECCVTRTGATSCTPKGECDGGVAITCNGPEECPVSGDVCCAELGHGTPSVSCTTMAACHGYVLCQSAADCPDMEPCDPGLDGYKYCLGSFHEPDGGFHHHHDGGFHPPDGGFVPPDGDLPP
jgi:hypothetical protein